MNIVRDAFGKTFRRPFTIVALVGVPLLVCLFGFLYATTFSDPYERMKDMPVAIVNLDEGVVVDGESRNYGADMLGAILDTDGVRWTEEDANLASEDALAQSGYYLAVVIPEDFSEQVAAGKTGAPEQAQMKFYRNVRKNFMLSTFGRNIESALCESVNAQVSAEYARAMAQGLIDAGDGMKDAADGAGQLADGTSQIASGASDVDNGANSALAGANTLASGATTLSEGAQSAAAGAAELSSGLSTLSSSGSQLTDGWANISSGISSVSSGANALAEGSSAYTSGLESARSNAGGDGAATNLAAAKTAYASAFSALQAALASGDPTSIMAAASNVNTAAQALAQASGAYGAVGALDGALAGYSGIGNGIDSLAAGASSLASGATNFGGGLSAYSAGVGTSSSGSSQLAAGTASLSSGASSLASGTSSLASGLSTLSAGTSSLSSGAQTLNDAAGKLADGLDDGASTISEAVTASAEEYGDYVSAPVEVSDEAIGDLDLFGYGFIPLFLTMCLWLGSLALFFVFDPFPSYEAFDAGRFAAVLGRWPLYLVMDVCIIASLSGVAAAMGLQTTNFGWLVLTISVLVVAFTAVLQLFSLFDIAGKALAVLLLIVQLVCASGTFPASLGSSFSSAVNPYLPFTYAIDAYREVLSGGNFSTLAFDLGAVASFGIAALALSLLLYPAAKKLKLKRDCETLERLSSLPASL